MNKFKALIYGILLSASLSAMADSARSSGDSIAILNSQDGDQIAIKFVVQTAANGGSSTVNVSAEAMRITLDIAARDCQFFDGYAVAKLHGVTVDGALIDQYVTLQEGSGCQLSGTPIYPLILSTSSQGQTTNYEQTLSVEVIKIDGEKRNLIDPINHTNTYVMHLVDAAR